MTVTATKPALFSAIKVGQHALHHRLVLAPLTRSRADPKSGVPSDDASVYYQQRATEGGLLITEATSISPSCGGYPGSPGIYSQDHIRAWKNVTTAVHEKKGVIFLQLWHPGRATFSFALPKTSATSDGKVAPVSASDIAIQGDSPFGMPYEKPRPLTVDEIKNIAQDFVQAAKKAIDAGFDGVEIHSANGYLLDQFINTSSNKRSDIYGGSIENRGRFPLQVVDAVSKAIGADRTAIRFSPYSGFQDMKDDTPVATWSYLVQQLEKTHPNLAYLHFVEPRVQLLDDGIDENDPAQDSDEHETLQYFRALWSGPFVSAGNYTYSAQSAYDRAESSPNNLVAVGRAFISNPDLVERFRNHLKLTPYNRNTFYSPGPEGYIDYPYYGAAN
ncbi:hypothetical protein BCR42DRAFT_472297 [Absidia repens]|uniref:NADH:flavin oxidoreductase/NADH oxidase N-terminal domain-containing protein n=1 Tax=Absidia repens TaxID=90262 RepID=A0A1X2I1M6_9FUNG|nr:hypothetical protein BCR42DRAFT_472297 [Absidia repens]